MLKRLFDICLSFIGLVILSPLFLVIITMLLFTMRGSVFFIHPRVGRGGNIFRLYKFRTMTNAPVKVEGVFNPGDKSRITRLGKMLRKYKLDELPQLFNVFIGDMSLVGPRPETTEWINAYPEKWKFVLNVRPGITDNASIEFRNEEDILAACENPAEMYRNVILPKKLEYYTLYASENSFLGDINIILKTFKIFFSK